MEQWFVLVAGLCAVVVLPSLILGAQSSRVQLWLMALELPLLLWLTWLVASYQR
jgi:hypothetical protein